MVIPKTVNLTRVVDNLKSTEVKLDAEDMRKLKELDLHKRLLKVSHKQETNGTPQKKNTKKISTNQSNTLVSRARPFTRKEGSCLVLHNQHNCNHINCNSIENTV